MVPALELKIGYQVTSRLRALVGYDMLYWNQIVRPGDQIDRSLNLSQSPVVGTTHGVLTGPASCLGLLFNRTDFWAQGFNVGLEFRY